MAPDRGAPKPRTPRTARATKEVLHAQRSVSHGVLLSLSYTHTFPPSQRDGMADSDRPRVAVIGAGHRGRGWAALALSRGWPVSLYDLDSALLQRASADVAQRVARLTDLGRGDPL